MAVQQKRRADWHELALFELNPDWQHEINAIAANFEVELDADTAAIIGQLAMVFADVEREPVHAS